MRPEISEETRKRMSESQKKRFEKPKEREKLYKKPQEISQQRISLEKQRKKMCDITINRCSDTCSLIKNHHEILKDDPERLSTDFMKKIINKEEDPCPEIL